MRILYVIDTPYSRRPCIGRAATGRGRRRRIRAVRAKPRRRCRSRASAIATCWSSATWRSKSSTHPDIRPSMFPCSSPIGRAADEPWFVLTGHTLMVGDVGRTELAATAEDGARVLFRSLQRLKALPDYLEVLPGAFSGSVCGRRLSGKPMSTIGFERRHNAAFRIEDEAGLRARHAEGDSTATAASGGASRGQCRTHCSRRNRSDAAARRSWRRRRGRND